MKKLLTTILIFLGLLTVGVTLGANAAAAPVATFDSDVVVDNSTYQTYSNDDWLVTCGGNQKSVGSNKTAANVAKCVLGSTYAYVGEPLGFTGTTATTAAVISKKAITNVKEINLKMDAISGSGNNGATTKISLVSSSTADSGYAQVDETKTFATSLTFSVNNTESKYYALVFSNTSGWFRLDNVVAEFMPNEIIEPGKIYYDVTFNAQNDTEAVVEKVEENTLASKPIAPKKEGFLFTGWYKEAECTNLFDFATETITASITLYAGWEIDPYNYATISGSDFDKLTAGSGYAPYNGSHILKNSDNTKTEFSYTSYQVMMQSNLLQFEKGNGYLYNGSNVKGHIASIEVENLTGELLVYTSNEMITNPTSLTENKLTTENSIYTVPEGSGHTFFYIKVGGTALAKVASIKIQYLYDEAFSKYSIRFNAGLGSFVEGKGTTISVEEGEAYTGNVPTVEDLSMTAYKYTNLVGWNDGVKTYAPGEAFEVNTLTVFNAVYEVPEKVSVEQAKEIAELAGSTKTSFKFSCEGLVSSYEKIDDKTISITLKDLNSDVTLNVYKAKFSNVIYVGDKIVVTGNLINFNGTTPQFDSGASYEITDNLISSFTHTQTMSSLRVQYDSDLMPVDVDFRFGAKIGLNTYNEHASYGVMVIDDATFNGFEAGATEYATADEFIAAHSGVKKMACPNGALLDDGYQFAWVITDMEGHYKTYFTAVIYMEYDGVLYLGVSKVKSVAQQASRYIEEHKEGNPEIVLTEEQIQLLQNIIAKEN